MIPKIIHHVWPGEDSFKEKFHAWRNTWMKHHSDWTFYFWRTNNLPENINLQVKTALLDPKYAITPRSDMLRFEVVRLFGGIYVDTDFECFKPFDQFLNHDFFSGWEDDNRRICPSLFGAIPNHPILTKMSEISIANAKAAGYEETNSRPHAITSVKPFTTLIKSFINDPKIKIYHRDYFYPVYFKEWKREKIEKIVEPFASHHWSGMHEDGWTKVTRF
jgi:mannosyltransferase OCH1-like enzyme